MTEAIATKRLLLVTLERDFLEASLNGAEEAARDLHDWTIPEEWFDEKSLMKIRIEDCDADELYIPWSLRAVVLRVSGAMVGHIGFHSRPGPEYLRTFAPGGVEFGYTIFKAYRRQGFALEAIRGLTNWATGSFGVMAYTVSIAPENVISQGLARKIGFRLVGGHQDPVDGWEDVYVLQGEDLQNFIRAA